VTREELRLRGKYENTKIRKAKSEKRKEEPALRQRRQWWRGKNRRRESPHLHCAKNEIRKTDSKAKSPRSASEDSGSEARIAGLKPGTYTSGPRM